MGSFSWEYASETSPVINICPGDEIKVLIPEHFGVGEIIGTYADYGIIEVGDKEYDIYDLLAVMNADSLSESDEPQRRAKQFYENKHLPTPQEVGDDEIRYIGINIESSGLEFPLKIVHQKKMSHMRSANSFQKGTTNKALTVSLGMGLHLGMKKVCAVKKSVVNTHMNTSIRH